ncbi:MEDS domain-containing protein [Actinokineospora diospyrosa]|uniref:MEDS domain-containing protein n=1 Tax=Actinokineospora diospyrosa TaxID=103728 RepID=UPI0020A47E67|nr:MEDS domain-containing protein [Actinokineospora diospyrosa]
MSRASDAGGREHLCWAFTDLDAFTARARDFLADGLAAGQRVCLVAPGDRDGWVERLRDLPGFDRPGAVAVRSLDGLYGRGAVVDPLGQVDTYAAETDQAVAEGFTGLRVAVEATDLVRTPAQLAAFARYEHVVDRYMAAHPFRAMCAYSAPELGTDVIAKLASLHPRGNVEPLPFRLHGWGASGTVALDGELDLRSHELFPWALRHAGAHWDGEVVIDARELGFVDHHGLLDLDEYATRRGLSVVLRTRRFSAARVADLLGVDSVRVEQVA